MNKLYVLILFVFLANFSFGQIGYSWWQILPGDYSENPHPREELKVFKVSDAMVSDFATIEDLWANIPADYHNGIGNWTNTSYDDFVSGAKETIEPSAPTADDFTASYAVLSDGNALYAVYNVTDQEVLPDGGDFIDLVFAPYAGQYDPMREIYPDMSRVGPAGHWYQDSVHVWGFDTGSNMPQSWSPIVLGDTYVDMAKYGTWSEAGSYKISIPLETNAEVFANTDLYTLKGENRDTLGDVTGGQIPVAISTLFEAKTGGYFFLAKLPWELLNNNSLDDAGDQMSIATKVIDYDSDHPEYQTQWSGPANFSNDFWGSTTSNEAYWAIGYYGAIATLDVVSSNNDLRLNNKIKAWFSDNNITIDGVSGDFKVEIFSLNGIKIGTYTNESNVDISSLIGGVYVANIFDDAGNRTLLKVIKAN